VRDASKLDPLWYKDAIIYQLHVKAFFDSDNDGMGDFKGLKERLDYIRDLGATAVWVMPFYPSPQRDDGYDISEYKNVHPDYGNKRDFRAFVRTAHDLGLKVITELVINHTSDQHPWFQRARKAPKGSARRTFYVWSDTTKKYEGTPIIFRDTENSNWAWDEEAGQYYWHRFFSHQPDLNHDNPQVFKAMMSVMRFWLDAGVDGLRLDAVPYLIEREGTNNESLPETHEILKKMRAEMDARYDSRVFLAEVNQWPEDLLPYFGNGEDECHMAFHFPLMPRIYMALAQEDRHPIVEIMHQTPEIPDPCQWAIFLRNHDELTLEMVTDTERDYMYQTYANDPRMRVNAGIRRRLAPMMENDRPRMELLNSLLMSMPGTPIIYYGDEIGMGDNIFLGDRDAVRTPMQWTSDRNAGFSRAEPARLYLPPIMDPVYGYESVNVEAQSRSAGSLVNWMKRIIAVRKAHKAFSRGTLEFLHPGNRKILAYIREYEDESILCVANLSRSAQPAELDLARFRDHVPVELLGGTSFPPLGNQPYMLTLPGHSFYWFRLTTKAAAPSWHQENPPVSGLPVLVLPAGRAPASSIYQVPLRLPDRSLAQLERDVLPSFLGARGWFMANEEEIEGVEVAAHSEFGPDRLLVLLRVWVGDGSQSTTVKPQRCFMPLSVIWEDSVDEDEISALMPHALAKLRRRARIGILYDALVDDSFCREVVAAIAENRKIGIKIGIGDGEIRFTKTGIFDELIGDEPATTLSVRRADAEQSSYSVMLGEKLALKTYRCLPQGTSPDLEVGRYLTEVVHFENTPPLAGAIELVGPDVGPTPLALLRGYVANQGDGWSFTLDYLKRYLEDRLITSWNADEEETAGRREQEVEDTFFANLARTLGVRTGELHSALAAPTQNEAFRPDKATPEEVRGWAANVLKGLERTLEMLEKRRDELPEGVDADVDCLLAVRDELAENAMAICDHVFEAAKTRYHGDYHLGRVLVANNDFQIIDFEGDPTMSLEKRRAKHSPLRDVATMLRSFNYAARSAIASLGTDRPNRVEDMQSWTLHFERRVRESFLGGYVEGKSVSISYPEDEGQASKLIELFTLERALYEIRHELNNRPTWASIPIKGIIDRTEELAVEDDT
jgi:maltose alpha-D-glucosyltransferase/alpha-amylase